MANNFLKRSIFLIAFISIGTLSLFAHPHVTVQAYSYNYFNKDGLQGIYMQWEFDPMFSSQLIYNYDTDNNMIFSKSETADLKSKYFDMLVEGGYYTEIQIDSKKMKNPLPVSFKATIDKEDEILIMSFFVPLSIPYSSSTSMYYSVSDSTSYTSFFIPQKDLRLKGSDYKILKKHINQFGEISYTFTKQ